MPRLILLLVSVATVSWAAQACANQVFSGLANLCGQAFEGRIVEDTQPSAAWAGKRIVMHVRDCGDRQLKVPLHVGGDRSRVWILTKLDDGYLQLKHDHRHADGSPDPVTMYGGKGVGAARFDFPVDAESVAMFEEQGLTASVTNTWTLSVEQPGTLSYQLVRPDGRRFVLLFDLTKPVPVPPPAWDLTAGSGHQAKGHE